MATAASNRRLPVGLDLIVVLVVVFVFPLLIVRHTPFSYLAVLAASGLRNVYFGWIGSGTILYAVAGVFMLAEALVLIGVYRLLRGTYRSLAGSSTE